MEHTALPIASASLELLAVAVEALLRRAYAQPRMRGRYAGGPALECALYRALSWERDFRLDKATEAFHAQGELPNRKQSVGGGP